MHVLQHAGAGLAPWNFDRYDFGGSERTGYTVDGAPLVFYHFHQFQLLEGGRFDRLSESYIAKRREPDDVYTTYEHALGAAIAEVRQHQSDFAYGIKSAAHVTSRRLVQRFVPRPVKELLRRAMTRMAGKL